MTLLPRSMASASANNPNNGARSSGSDNNSPIIKADIDPDLGERDQQVRISHFSFDCDFSAQSDLIFAHACASKHKQVKGSKRS